MQSIVKLICLPGDGIGPEVTRAALAVLEAAGRRFDFTIEAEEELIGGAALRATGEPLPAATRAAVTQAKAVLLGAVGDPAFDGEPPERKPETGLLALRKLLGCWANVRPVRRVAGAGTTPLREEIAARTDLVVVRELTGGLYFGEPRGFAPDHTEAHNTMRYSAGEIERLARFAFKLARERNDHLTSVDKANVLEVSQLWRSVFVRVAREFPDVRLDHLYVDNAAMQLMLRPGSFDVIATGNLFGDILSDEAAVLAGSLGLLPSASLGGAVGLYEPVHGSAPDLAGKDRANPAGAILSAAMMLRHSFPHEEAAAAIESAVDAALRRGPLPADLAVSGAPVASTAAFTAAVIAGL
ncbi:MAG: 3-isopropylmalate dehydrogenase [Acidobacteria bacterium]|nr:MAG: 3-isopropylmalate dehydrogenase [Acidobacteriota bacterium]